MRGSAKGDRAGLKVNVDVGVVSAEVDRIETVAADIVVSAARSAEPVVARAAVEGVVAAVAVEVVIEGRADHALDAREGVAGRVAAGGRAVVKIDGHARAGARVGRHVVTRAADERVRAAAAFERVVAVAAVERVDAGVAGEAVARRGADHVLEIRQRVAFSVAADLRERGEGHRDPGARTRIAHRVDPRAAVERVRPGAAGDQVGAEAARQAVRIGVAREGVVVIRADEVLNADDLVAGGVAARRGSDAEIDEDARARSCIGKRVDARAAHDRVAARAAPKRVVAVTAVDPVRGRVAAQGVGEARAGDVLDPGEQIALRMAAGLRRREPEVDRHRGVRAGVDRRVEIRAADQRVGAGPAFERVRAGAAVEPVRAVVARQRVARGRADQVLDIGDRVPGRVAAGRGPGPEIDRDAARGRCVARGVDARAAVDHVAAEPAGKQVRALAAEERVGAGEA